MDDLGIAPPAAPGAQVKQGKKGFLKQFFTKKESDEPVMSQTMSEESSRIQEEEFDIENIRKKMGLETIDEQEKDILTPQNMPDGDHLPELPAYTQEFLEEEPIMQKEERTQDFSLEQTPARKEEPAQTEFTQEEPAQEKVTRAEFDVEPEHQQEENESEQEIDWSKETHHQANEPTQAPSQDLDAELDELHAQLDAQDVSENSVEAQEETSLPKTVDAKVGTTLKKLEKQHDQIDAQLEQTIKSIHAKTPEWATQKREVTPQEYFTLKNGQKIRSFQELLGALSFIDEETFTHHVTDGRNDFAEWVKHVLAEEKLAERIRNKVARQDLLKILRSHETTMLKRFETESKKFQALTLKQKEKQKKITKLNEEIATLAAQVKKQSSELKALRGKSGKEIKQSVAQHVEKHHAKNANKLDEKEAQLEKIEESITKKQEDLAAKEKEVDANTKELIAEQKELDEEKATLQREKKQAQMLLSQAQELRKMRSESERDLSAIKALLEKNKKATTSLQKQEKATMKVLGQLEKDKKNMDAEVKMYSELKTDVDAREKVIAQNEKTSAQKITRQEKASKQKVAKKEKEIAQKLASADKWYKQVKADKEEFTALQRKEITEQKAKKKEVETLVKELDKKTETYRELVEKHERDLARNEEVLQETQRIREEIQKRQEALSSDSMKEYLRTKSTDAVIERLSNTSVPDVEEISNLHLYKLVDQCKDALGNSDLDKARKVYKQLRDEFGSTKLTSHEKSVLYNSIRELYDDIHLAMLNQ